MGRKGWLPGADGALWAAQLAQEKPAPGEALFLAVATPSQAALPQVWAWARQQGVVLAGSLFPGLIRGDRVEREGAWWRRMPLAVPPLVLRSTRELSWGGELHGMTAVLLFNGVQGETEKILELLYDGLGRSVNYVGAVGEYELSGGRSCLFTQDGWCEAAGLALFVPGQLRTSLGHGLRRLEGPLVVTRAAGNRVWELNWQPAAAAYAAVLAAHGLPAAEFGRFPLGVLSENGEDLVRSVLELTPEGALVCAGAVPENAVLGVLVAREQDMLAAAAAAARAAAGGGGESAFLIHCQARAALGGSGALERELGAIKRALQAARPGLGQSLQGVLSYGEIVSPAEGVVELCNKTLVIGVVP